MYSALQQCIREPHPFSREGEVKHELVLRNGRKVVLFLIEIVPLSCRIRHFALRIEVPDPPRTSPGLHQAQAQDHACLLCTEYRVQRPTAAAPALPSSCLIKVALRPLMRPVVFLSCPIPVPFRPFLLSNHSINFLVRCHSTQVYLLVLGSAVVKTYHAPSHSSTLPSLCSPPLDVRAIP